MTVVELLQELRRLKVSISASNARLVVDAPAGVITPALAQEIKSNKAALLDLIGSIGEEQAAEKTELTRAPDEDRLSLTQERIWAIDQLNPDSSQFNLPGGWWLDGALDVDVLARAVSEFADAARYFPAPVCLAQRKSTGVSSGSSGCRFQDHDPAGHRSGKRRPGPPDALVRRDFSGAVRPVG